MIFGIKEKFFFYNLTMYFGYYYKFLPVRLMTGFVVVVQGHIFITVFIFINSYCKFRYCPIKNDSRAACNLTVRSLIVNQEPVFFRAILYSISNFFFFSFYYKELK